MRGEKRTQKFLRTAEHPGGIHFRVEDIYKIQMVINMETFL